MGANDNERDPWDAELERHRKNDEWIAQFIHKLRAAMSMEERREICSYRAMELVTAYPDKAALAWLISEHFAALDDEPPSS